MDEVWTSCFDTHYGEQWAANDQSIEADLADPVQRRALSLQFRPQFDLQTRAGIAVEVLAWWALPSGKVHRALGFHSHCGADGMRHTEETPRKPPEARCS